MRDNLVQVTGLTKFYGAKKALNDVNLTIQPGKIVGILARTVRVKRH